ncbi:hypothetical protein ACFOWE_29135 [Planomonospora corallina]|uniref:Uncharacterized protein n=1 Tax=Planomonospora corallina TaxID=1806052 RepID=A0ABV8IDS0_9ACTN
MAHLRGLPVALVTCAYAAAVLTLTWLTQDGHLGDAMYGVLTMVVVAFPLSIVGDSVYGAIIGQRHDDPAYGWQYVEMGWPGIAMALSLLLLLTWRRTRLAGQVMGWALTTAILLVGAGMVFGWAPRQPYGWPFIAYGLLMAIGMIAVHRSALKGVTTGGA